MSGPCPVFEFAPASLRVLESQQRTTGISPPFDGSKKDATGRQKNNFSRKRPLNIGPGARRERAETRVITPLARLMEVQQCGRYSAFFFYRFAQE